MSDDWLRYPIYFQRKIVSHALRTDQPLVQQRAEIAFRAMLLFNVWQAYACDGRQMSINNLDKMEDFEARFSDLSLSEQSLGMLIYDYGDFIPAFLTNPKLDIPERALSWTVPDVHWRQDANPDS
ncbi:MAG: hypothetical protein ACRC8S_09390 [Fimbriiglobus sp.]